MLQQIHPKLPMTNKSLTKDFYINKLGFKDIGNMDYDGYLMVEKDNIEIHFFEHNTLNPKENYGQIYIRVNDIDAMYQRFINNKIDIHPNDSLSIKPWQQKEFSILDPDNNLITFGESN